MKLNKNKSVYTIINSLIVLTLSVVIFTGCESIEFLLDQNEKYEEEDRLEALEEAGQEEIASERSVNEEAIVDQINEELEEEFAEEEISLTDELIAADGLIINRELDYETYLGASGQAIIEELFVVRRDEDHRYGDVLNYNGNKFFCNEEDICYAVYVKKDKALGIDFPAARTEVVRLMGAPIFANEEYQYYNYMDHILRVPAKNNEIKHGIVAKDMDGLVAMMASFNEETSYELISMMDNSKFEIMSQLGPAERESIDNVLVMHYDYQGIYVKLKGNEGEEVVTNVLLTNYGGFGIDIGTTKSVLAMYYVEPIVKSDYYLYQYEDTFYGVFFEDDIVIGLSVMSEEEAMKLASIDNYLEWADVNVTVD